MSDSKSSKTYNVRVPVHLHDELVRQASVTGVARSTLLCRMAEAGLDPERQRSLAEAQEAARAKNPVVAAARDLEAALGRLRAIVGGGE